MHLLVLQFLLHLDLILLLLELVEQQIQVQVIIKVEMVVNQYFQQLHPQEEVAVEHLVLQTLQVMVDQAVLVAVPLMHLVPLSLRELETLHLYHRLKVTLVVKADQVARYHLEVEVVLLLLVLLLTVALVALVVMALLQVLLVLP
jgi:hypothetical protein